MGRKKELVRTAVFYARISRENKKFVEKLSQSEGMNVSQWTNDHFNALRAAVKKEKPKLDV